jgi:glutamate-1-semialdehyde-2,1-aminomutase
MNFSQSKKFFEEAIHLIPGGVTNARHPVKFVPGKYPIFTSYGRGSHIWDVDGNEFIDWVCSFGPLILGHCNENVDRAVVDNLKKGFCFTMVNPVQNTLVKKLIEIIPCAEMAKILTSGSDSTAAAIRIARVFTGRDKVIRWGYHGWHDWCYGGTGSDRESVGVPESVKSEVLSFIYNDLDSLYQVFKENKDTIACVIMQPFEASNELPSEGFLEGVKKITHDNNAVLIFDEIRTGFRVSLGGAQEYFNVIPDLACFSKAIANGYPISAVVGKKEIMEPSKNTRISGTFFVNTFPMVAALATIQEIEKKNGIEYMWSMGKKLWNGFEKIIDASGINAKMIGLPVIPMLKFFYKDSEKTKEYRDYFFAEMVNRGILMHPNHHWFLSLAINEDDINRTLNSAEECFDLLKKKFF